MTTKTKVIFNIGALALSLMLVTFTPGKTKADNRVRKFSVWHNDPHHGHFICIPQPAVDAHMREHQGDYVAGPCDLIGD